MRKMHKKTNFTNICRWIWNGLLYIENFIL